MKYLLPINVILTLYILAFAVYAKIKAFNVEVGLRSDLAKLKNEQTIDRYYDYVNLFDSSMDGIQNGFSNYIYFACALTILSIILLAYYYLYNPIKTSRCSNENKYNSE